MTQDIILYSSQIRKMTARELRDKVIGNGTGLEIFVRQNPKGNALYPLKRKGRDKRKGRRGYCYYSIFKNEMSKELLKLIRVKLASIHWIVVS